MDKKQLFWKVLSLLAFGLVVTQCFLMYSILRRNDSSKFELHTDFSKGSTLLLNKQTGQVFKVNNIINEWEPFIEFTDSSRYAKKQ
jgi:hypothetical protein